MGNQMIRTLGGKFRTVLATAALAGGVTLAMAAPSFADMGDHPLKQGEITVYSTSGAVTQMQVNDKAMLDEITKDATVLDDHTMVVMNNGKLYLVKDHKMANGKTVSEVIMHMGSKS